MKQERPWLITCICLLGFVGASVSIPLALSDEAVGIGRFYPIFLLLITACNVVCFVGLWRMKKWSVLAFVFLAGLAQAMMVVLGIWSLAALIGPGIVIAIGLFYYDLLDA